MVVFFVVALCALIIISRLPLQGVSSSKESQLICGEWRSKEHIR